MCVSICGCSSASARQEAPLTIEEKTEVDALETAITATDANQTIEEPEEDCNYRLHSNQHHRLGSTITKTVDTGLASLPALSFFYIHAAHREVKTLVPCKSHSGRGTH